MAAKTAVQKKAKKAVTPKTPKPVKSTAKFISLSVEATIPVQSYGNIMPKVTVEAATYEEARDMAFPIIEGIYAKYAEKKPDFLGKIVETVKVVTPAPAPKAEEPAAPSSVAPSAPLSSTSTIPKSEAVLKAEKAISLAASEDAMLAIQGQIEKSVKITSEEKPALLTLCLKRRGELTK